MIEEIVDPRDTRPLLCEFAEPRRPPPPPLVDHPAETPPPLTRRAGQRSRRKWESEPKAPSSSWVWVKPEPR